jgi:hypothetical protein
MGLGSEFQTNAGASEEVVERTLFELERSLPNDYLDFMRRSDGGGGFINGHYLVLWPLDELVALNRTFREIDDVATVVWFGSNGGGEAFGFDWSQSGAVVEGPMIGMERDQLLYCADTFTEFLRNPTGFKE